MKGSGRQVAPARYGGRGSKKRENEGLSVHAFFLWSVFEGADEWQERYVALCDSRGRNPKETEEEERE